jgi:hypothetical protein
MTDCEARLELADDYGDNDCTFHCDLKKGHFGFHQERGNGKPAYIMIWDDSK